MAKKETETTTVAKTEAPDAMIVAPDYGDDAGRGYEHITKDDVTIPFINMLQALSPIVVAENAKSGDFFNTVTEEIWSRDKGFLFVPGTTRRLFAEWVPRNQGGSKGAFRGHHEVESEVVLNAIKNSTERFKLKHENGNNLVDTRYVYGALCDEDGNAVSMAVVAFFVTKIKPFKAWISRIGAVRVPVMVGDKQVKKQPPMYGNLVRMSAFLDTNKDGKQFYNYKLSAGDPRGLIHSLLGRDDERFQMAKACQVLVDSGSAKVDFDKQTDAPEDDGEAAPF